MKVINDIVIGEVNTSLTGLVELRDLVRLNTHVAKAYAPDQRFTVTLNDATSDVIIRTASAEADSVPIMAFRKIN